ncbi:hypothetical protein B0I35DRAFT_417092 [Stachybotrys elegans]|uniref:N-acetyltransferase domain-containing protein n=1 Tax=Stachybotrys elegans TaxID=80388 RepID=A0A8K0T2R3_9HYPO|nr:hypothetical protein B0I35DRAFT_417092 [Stachybotrys elegans]
MLILQPRIPFYMSHHESNINQTYSAFFTFLRANLVLPPSAMSSNPGTPYLEPWTTHTPTPPATSSPLAADPQVEDLDDIPPLYLEPLESEEDKVAGLRLVADSVAQMSQQASRSLVFHPLCLGALTASLAAAYHYGYKPQKDVGMGIVLFCGIVASYLSAIRYVASSYIHQAEKIGWSWLQNENGYQDILIGARFDSKIVGALVLKLEPNLTVSGKKKGRNSMNRGGQAVIRAWTTHLKYRSQGVGRDLLWEAVRVAKERCGKDTEVGFAQAHVNSTMILPEMFNKPFRRQEKRATHALHDVLVEWEGTKKKR